MTNHLWAASTAGAFLLLLSTSVAAQTARRTPLTLPAHRQLATNSALGARAALSVKNESLDRALTELHRTSGISLLFSPSELPKDVRVTCACQRATVGEALSQLLQRTGMEIREIKGEILVVPSKPRARPVPGIDLFLARLAPVTSAGILTSTPLITPRAQEGTIAGVVIDAQSQQPLVGAQVFVVGSDRGTVTDAGGRFRLTGVLGNSVTVQVTMLGYRTRTQEIRVGVANHRFELEVSAVNLDELVVTGTPTATPRRAIGNAVTKIKAAEIVELSPIRSVSDLLAGRAPSVVIMPGTGVVGAGPRFQIRGRGTLVLAPEPLVYIDGVRSNNDVGTGPLAGAIFAGANISRLGDLNPDEIESIEIIKGPAAATLYGTEASNGVIQIITKKGAIGEPVFNLGVRQGANWFMNPEGRIDHNFGLDPVTGQLIELDLLAQEAAAGRPIFKTGHLQGYDLDLSGGSGILRYYLGGGYDNEQGVEPTNAFRRLSGRVNLTISPNPTYDITVNVGIMQTRRDLSADRGLSVIYATQFGRPSLLNTPTRGFLGAPPEFFWSAYEIFQDVDRTIAGLTVTHRPLSWLTHRFTAGMDGVAEDNQVITEVQPDSLRIFMAATDRDGRKVVTRRLRSVNTLDYGLTASRRFSSRLHSTTSAGAQYFRDFTEDQSSEGRGFPAPDIRTVTAAAQTFGGDNYVENTTVGIYLQQQFALNDRIFLTAGVRADDNSAFGRNFDLVYYPKVSAAWVVSEEPFWSFDWVNALRLRGAYGESGQQPRAFSSLRTYLPTSGEGGSAVTPLAIGNPELGPERGEEIELGFEAGLLNDRVGIDFTYYHKDTKGMILTRSVAPSTGFFSQQLVNTGLVTNQGFELLLNTVPLAARSLQWNLTLTMSSNDSKIIDIDPDDPSRTFISPFATLRHAEGYPIGSQFRKRIVSATYNPTTRRAENVLCDSGTGQSVPCVDAPFLYIGRPSPKYEGGVTNTLTILDRLALSAQVDFKQGHTMFDATTLSRCVTNRVCELNAFPERFDPLLVAESQADINHTARLTVPNASFVKLREVAARYMLPDAWARRLSARRVSLAVAARNLHTWTDYSGLDPETFDIGLSGQGIYYDQTTMPPLASFLATVRLSW